MARTFPHLGRVISIETHRVVVVATAQVDEKQQ
jgi:hypothetical protein